MNEWPTAIELYRRFLKMRPNDIDAMYNLALALECQGSHEAALSELEKCLRLMPKSDNKMALIRLEVGRLQSLIEEKRAAPKMMVVNEAVGESLLAVSKTALLNQDDFESCKALSVDSSWQFEMKLTNAGVKKIQVIAKQYFCRSLIFISKGLHVLTMNYNHHRSDGKIVLLSHSETQVKGWENALMPNNPFEVFCLHYSFDPDEDQKAHFSALLEQVQKNRDDLNSFELQLISDQLKQLSSQMKVDGSEEMELLMKTVDPLINRKIQASSLYEIAFGRGEFETDIFAGDLHKGLGSAARRTLAIKLQGKLRSEGFDPGPIDGQPGKKTCQALVDYQQSYGLPVTAVLDNDSLLMLNLDEVKAQSAEGDIRQTASNASTVGNAPRSKSKQPSVAPSTVVPNASWEERFRAAAKKFESRRPK